VANETGLLLYELAAGEDGEVGDAAYVVTGRELRVALGVYFEDYGLACGVGGCAGYLGRGCPAGAAPVGPEVDQDWDAGVLDDVVEEGGVGLDGLVEGREWVFAGSATAGVGEVLGVYTVLLAAAFAGCDDGHLVCLRLIYRCLREEIDAGRRSCRGNGKSKSKKQILRCAKDEVF
jgi:hypothetical protein